MNGKHNFAIILSAGIGQRMRSDGFPKQYIEVDGKPVIVYTLEVFDQCDDIDQIILVCSPEWQEKLDAWCCCFGIHKPIRYIAGGESRQESIFNGLVECMHLSGSQDDKVIIHDAARPLVSCGLIKKCLSELPASDGCMPVLPSIDTYYLSKDRRTISGLIDRSQLFAGQAPEAFLLKKYYEANKKCSRAELAEVRGTSEIAFKSGLRIALTEGDELNFKLTTPADLERFQTIVEARKNESISAV